MLKTRCELNAAITVTMARLLEESRHDEIMFRGRADRGTWLGRVVDRVHRYMQDGVHLSAPRSSEQAGIGTRNRQNRHMKERHRWVSSHQHDVIGYRS